MPTAVPAKPGKLAGTRSASRWSATSSAVQMDGTRRVGGGRTGGIAPIPPLQPRSSKPICPDQQGETANGDRYSEVVQRRKGIRLYSARWRRKGRLRPHHRSTGGGPQWSR